METNCRFVKFCILKYQRSKAAAAKGEDDRSIQINTYVLKMPYPHRFDLLPSLSSIETIVRRKFNVQDQFKARIYIQSSESNEFECLSNEEQWRTALQIQILGSGIPVINLLVSIKHRFQNDPGEPVNFAHYDFESCEIGSLDLPAEASQIENPEVNKEEPNTIREVVMLASAEPCVVERKEFTPIDSSSYFDGSKGNQPAALMTECNVVCNSLENPDLNNNDYLQVPKCSDQVFDLSMNAITESSSLIMPDVPATKSESKFIDEILNLSFAESIKGKNSSENRKEEVAPVTKLNVSAQKVKATTLSFNNDDITAGLSEFDEFLANANKLLKGHDKLAGFVDQQLGNFVVSSPNDPENGQLSPVAICIQKSIDKFNDDCSENIDKVTLDKAASSQMTHGSVSESNIEKSIEEHESHDGKNVEKISEMMKQKCDNLLECLKIEMAELKCSGEESSAKFFHEIPKRINSELGPLLKNENRFLEQNLFIFLKEQFEIARQKRKELFDSNFDMIRKQIIEEQASTRNFLNDSIESLKCVVRQISNVLDHFPSHAVLSNQDLDRLSNKIVKHLNSSLGGKAVFGYCPIVFFLTFWLHKKPVEQNEVSF